MRDKMLEAALRYAKRGDEILPGATVDESGACSCYRGAACKTPGKHPLVKGGKDFKNATTNEAQIREWFRRWPDANILMRAKGKIIFDVESAEGHPTQAANAKEEGKRFGFDALKELEQEDKNGPLPDTHRVATPTGGEHIEYLVPPELKGKVIKTDRAPGVEVKSSGVVVTSPSVRKGKSYKDLDDSPRAVLSSPQWIEFLVAESPTIVKTPHTDRNSETICDHYGIDLFDVCSIPAKAHRVGGEYVFSHPLHGSDTGTNFHVRTDGTFWFCERHQRGGDALQFVAMENHLVECEDMAPLEKDTAKRCLEVLRNEGTISETLADVPDEDKITVDTTAHWLIHHPTEFMVLGRFLIDKYHYGETSLKNGYWRGSHRVAFSSSLALIHFDLMSPSRGGKSTILYRFFNLIPKSRRFMIVRASPRSLWYATKVWVEFEVPQRDKKTNKPMFEDDGNPLMKTARSKEPDPDFYVGKWIILTEIADMGTFDALKSFEDEKEISYDNWTVIDGEHVNFTIHGPRGVAKASLRGVRQDEGGQINKRSIQTPLTDKNEKDIEARNYLIGDNDDEWGEIDSDPLLPVINRAFELLWFDGMSVKPTPMSPEVKGVRIKIDNALTKDGFETTQIRQFHSFAWCAAFEKRFERGDVHKLELRVEDLLEAWWIITEFGPYARAGIDQIDREILEYLSKSADEAKIDDDKKKSPQEIRAGVHHAGSSINESLRLKKENQGRLVDLDYVEWEDSKEGRGSVFWINAKGKKAVGALTKKIKIGKTTFKPKNPCPEPLVRQAAELLNSANSVKFAEIQKLSETVSSFYAKDKEVKKILEFKFVNSVKKEHYTDFFTTPRDGSNPTSKTQLPPCAELPNLKKVIQTPTEALQAKQPQNGDKPDELLASKTDFSPPKTDFSPQKTNKVGQKTHQDQAELMQLIRKTMIEWPDIGKKPSRDYFVSIIAATIHRRDPRWVGYNLEYEMNRLAEVDPEIQALLAERTSAV